MGLPERFRPKPSYTSIIGLSTTMRMPRLGKIRLGVKVKNSKGVEYPKDLDYFVVPPEVQEVYGKQPRELDVLIPSTDPALYFPQALKWYKGSRLICKGNGETATRINESTGDMVEMACPCDQLHDSQTNPKGSCRARANLMVILPKVSMGGAYQIDTGSTNNIINLNSTLTWIQSMLGRVAWVPLVLKRVSTKIQTPDGATTKALLQLEFRGDAKDAAALRKMDWIAIQGGTVPAALPPAAVDDDGPGDVTADVVDEDTGEVIDENGGKTPEPEITADKAPSTEEREPGADENEDIPSNEPEKKPEPAPTRAPKNPIAELVDSRKILLNSAGTKTILEAVWSEIIKDKRIPGVEKARLQAVYDKKRKEIG